ncbi:gamma-glutamyltransferase [Psychrosphaera algicola]|uniref:Gamma-glutamyltransferase n=1 Tax=Psychrosphaera algicola TaxID=3023714 RepID=A0ABT5FEW6_9GAMM|nr:gamma-glutamyltransferase [Psychrosphaera sp. G1-22]MDC2890095.1 gamma-glutamyltransferase [Psychrosphaera sp. G1-22]
MKNQKILFFDFSIIRSHYRVYVYIIKITAQSAVDTPRFHHQLWPINEIKHFSGIDHDVLNKLEKMGYNLVEGAFGDLQIVIKQGNKLQAASETNKFNRGVAKVLEQ